MSLTRSSNRKSTKSLVVKVVNHRHQSGKVRKFLSCALLLIITLGFSVGCTVAIGNDQLEVNASTPADVEPGFTETLLPTSTSASTPVQTATVLATSTATVVLKTPTPEPQPTPDESIDWEGQQLITLRNDGVYQLNLATNELEMIAPIVYKRDEEQLLSAATFSYDGKKAIYWFPDGEGFQVWLVDIIDGSSQQLLSITNDNFTRADGEWHGQDRFFELGIRGEGEYGVPMVVQWYLFDILEGEIIGTATDRPGMRICHTIAVSPESNQVATWCSFDSQLEEQRQYFVIEIDGSWWQTTMAPEEPLAVTHELREQIWSLNRNILLIPSGRNAVIVNIPGKSTHRLFDERDAYAQTFGSRLSPNGRLLGYNYEVCGAERFCAQVMDIESRTVLWDSTGLFSLPPNISWSAHVVAWSPDGRFFVVSGYDGAFIIRVDDFSVVKALPADSVMSIGGITWLNN